MGCLFSQFAATNNVEVSQLGATDIADNRMDLHTNPDVENIDDVHKMSRQQAVDDYCRRWSYNSKGSDALCSICLESFAIADAVVTLPCFHIFHATCVDDWLSRSEELACPECALAILPTK